MEPHPFFAAAPEDVRVAALEADDGFALAPELDEELIGFLLGQRVVCRPLADVNPFAVRRHVLEQGGIHKGVVHDGVALGQHPPALEGQQLGIAAAAANQIHFAYFLTHPSTSPFSCSASRRPRASASQQLPITDAIASRSPEASP